MTFILLWGTGNIDRISEVQFDLPRNDGKYVHISCAPVSETCGLICNKLDIHGFSMVLFFISKFRVLKNTSGTPP